MIATLAALAVAASFDCARASHPLERTICASPSLAAADAEAARLYREKLAVVFDRRAFRTQQQQWQRTLRSVCQTGCAQHIVADAYQRQITFLRDFAREEWEANYKTTDYVALGIVHEGANRFAFDMTRGNVDDDTNQYCRIPQSEADDLPVAKLVSPTRATWTGGACTITFNLKRDAAGDVGGIDVATGLACRTWCADQRYRLDDKFYATNDWTAKAP